MAIQRGATAQKADVLASQGAGPAVPTDFQAMQEGRLKEINEQLAERGLPLIKGLGDYREGDEEYVRIESFLADNKWFVLVLYEMRKPITGERRMRYITIPRGEPGTEPINVVPMLNDKVIYTNAHRPAQAGYEDDRFGEAPRQWAAEAQKCTLLSLKFSQDPALDGLADELKQAAITLLGTGLTHLLAGRKVRIRECFELVPRDAGPDFHGYPEDSASRTSRVRNLAVRFEADEGVERELIKQARKELPESLSLQFLTVEQAYHQAFDNHTRSLMLALALHYNAIDFSMIADGRQVRRLPRRPSLGFRQRRFKTR